MLKYLVGIRIGDAPITDRPTAQAAIESFGWSGLEAEDAPSGAWLVSIDAKTRRKLTRTGFVELQTGDITITAEMP